VKPAGKRGITFMRGVTFLFAMYPCMSHIGVLRCTCNKNFELCHVRLRIG